MEAFPDENHTYKKQIHRQQNIRMGLDGRPGGFHLCTPVDIVKDEHGAGRGMVKKHFKILKGGFPAMIAIDKGQTDRFSVAQDLRQPIIEMPPDQLYIGQPKLPEMSSCQISYRGGSLQGKDLSRGVTAGQVSGGQAQGGSQFYDAFRLVITGHPVQQLTVFFGFGGMDCQRSNGSVSGVFLGRSGTEVLHQN